MDDSVTKPGGDVHDKDNSSKVKDEVENMVDKECVEVIKKRKSLQHLTADFLLRLALYGKEMAQCNGCNQKYIVGSKM